MSFKATLGSMVALLAVVGTVRAGDTPELQFSYTAPGGLIPAIDLLNNDSGWSVFPLSMNGEIPQIESIELVLTGLTHTQPEDLDILLISPFGETVVVMSGKGDGVAIIDMDFVFNDLGSPLPADGVPLTAGTYQTQDPDGGMSKYIGNSGGTDSWQLVIIDSAEGDQGFLESYTLRGTYIPEPASLALLGFGALAALRRRSLRLS